MSILALSRLISGSRPVGRGGRRGGRLFGGDRHIARRLALGCRRGLSEFFVLESANDSSIAFLVPFLLSAHIQSILAASQEGGHHPRFSEGTLKSLPVPEQLIERRSALSAQVERAVSQARAAYRTIEESVAAVGRPTCEEIESSRCR